MTEQKPTTSATLRYLADHVDWLAHRPEALDAFDELHDAVSRLRTAIDNTGDLAYSGPCDVCGRDMYARPGSAVVECEPCALIYDIKPRRDWLLDQAEDRLETASNIARALTAHDRPITPERVRKWGERGLITAHAKTSKGDPLYRFGDVRRLAEKPPRRGPKPRVA